MSASSPRDAMSRVTDSQFGNQPIAEEAGPTAAEQRSLGRRPFLRRAVGISAAAAFSLGSMAAGLGAAGGEERASGEAVPQDPPPEGAARELGIDARIRAAAEQAPLAMQFEGTTAEEFRTWHRQFESVLRKCLGNPRVPNRWEEITESRREFGDHTRVGLLLTAADHAPLPVYLLIPKGLKPGEKRPGVLAIHGHGKYGNQTIAGCDEEPGVAQAIAGSNGDYGRQLVRQGYVVACPCLTPFGRRLGSNYEGYRHDPCGVTFVRMQLLGKILMAENLRDCLWTLERLVREPCVDADRLGCVGLSYGGRMTMLTAALEPRIKVAVPSGALNVMQERIGVRYSCGAQVIPGLLRYGDVPEIASLIAPRVCLWEVGSRDGLIKPDWAEAAMVRMRRAWQAASAAEHLQVDRFEGGHRWHGTVAYELLRRELFSA